MDTVKQQVRLFIVTAYTLGPSRAGRTSWTLKGHDAAGAPLTARLEGVGYQSAKGWFMATVQGHVMAGNAHEYPIVIEGGMARVGNYGIFESDLVFQENR